jgi:hypothetical protein
MHNPTPIPDVLRPTRDVAQFAMPDAFLPLLITGWIRRRVLAEFTVLSASPLVAAGYHKTRLDCDEVSLGES